MPPHRRTALLLAALAAAFAARVAGQAAVWTDAPGTRWLPPMEAWFSGLVPYPVLLPIQLAILAAQAWHIVHRWRTPVPTRRPWIAVWLFGFAACYAGGMLLRYAIANALNGPGPSWWSNGLVPVAFHQVLAAYVAVWGWSLHSERRANPMR